MSTALVHVEAMTALEIFKPGAIDPIIEGIEAEVRSQAAQLDISTEANRKALASLAFKVAKSKTFVESQRKALVADEKKRLAKIDEEGRRIWNRFEALQDEVRKPLTDWENAEKSRIADHEAALKEIEAAAVECQMNYARSGSAIIQSRIESIEKDCRDWEEFGQRAAGVKAVALNSMRRCVADAQKLEEERAESERLRAEAAERAIKEREEAAAKAAKEKAEKEAAALAEYEARKAEGERQRLENERLQAEARAKQAEAQRIAAEQAAERRAKEAAEQAKRDQEAAIERERQRVAAEAERERQAAEKREANKKHKAKINREAAAALEKNCVLDAGVAELIVIAIAKGLIPNITIAY